MQTGFKIIFKKEKEFFDKVELAKSDDKYENGKFFYKNRQGIYYLIEKPYHFEEAKKQAITLLKFKKGHTYGKLVDKQIESYKPAEHKETPPRVYPFDERQAFKLKDAKDKTNAAVTTVLNAKFVPTMPEFTAIFTPKYFYLDSTGRYFQLKTYTALKTAFQNNETVCELIKGDFETSDLSNLLVVPQDTPFSFSSQAKFKEYKEFLSSEEKFEIGKFFYRDNSREGVYLLIQSEEQFKKLQSGGNTGLLKLKENYQELLQKGVISENFDCNEKNETTITVEEVESKAESKDSINETMDDEIDDTSTKRCLSGTIKDKILTAAPAVTTTAALIVTGLSAEITLPVAAFYTLLLSVPTVTNWLAAGCFSKPENSEPLIEQPAKKCLGWSKLMSNRFFKAVFPSVLAACIAEPVREYSLAHGNSQEESFQTAAKTYAGITAGVSTVVNGVDLVLRR